MHPPVTWQVELVCELANGALDGDRADALLSQLAVRYAWDFVIPKLEEDFVTNRWRPFFVHLVVPVLHHGLRVGDGV